MTLKQKEIFNKLVDKTINEITELSNEVSPDNLKYKYKGPTASTKSNMKKDKKRLKSKLGEIKNETII